MLGAPHNSLSFPNYSFAAEHLPQTAGLALRLHEGENVTCQNDSMLRKWMKKYTANTCAWCAEELLRNTKCVYSQLLHSLVIMYQTENCDIVITQYATIHTQSWYTELVRNKMIKGQNPWSTILLIPAHLDIQLQTRISTMNLKIMLKYCPLQMEKRTFNGPRVDSSHNEHDCSMFIPGTFYNAAQYVKEQFLLLQVVKTECLNTSFTS